jgi:peptidoglycan hydrolase-like protein with peptidoglycan-binding domain
MAQSQLSPGMVKSVQSSLAQKGMYKGDIDGVWGPQTQSAVQMYQKDHGMMATGELNAATLAALVPPDPAAMPPPPPPPMAPTTSAAPAAPNTTMTTTQ